MSWEVAAARLGTSDAITADRYELTYLVPQSPCHELLEHFEERLGQPNVYTVTTVYFDTASRRLLGAALGLARESVKLRAKEYGDERAEPAAAWLELKRRSGARTQKHRVQLGRSALERWVCERAAPAASDYVGRESDARVLAEYFGAEPEPLSPACVVSYRRRAWQAADGELRLTLDTGLAFFAPPVEVFRSGAPFRAQLGAARESEPSALLEVKHRAQAMPAWLGARLRELALEASDYSKFVKASLAVSDLTGTI